MLQSLLYWEEQTIKTHPSVQGEVKKKKLFGGLTVLSFCVTVCQQGWQEGLAYCFLHHIKITLMLWEALLDLQRITAGQCQSFAASAWVIRTSGDDSRQKERTTARKRDREREITEGKQGQTHWQSDGDVNDGNLQCDYYDQTAKTGCSCWFKCCYRCWIDNSERDTQKEWYRKKISTMSLKYNGLYAWVYSALIYIYINLHLNG